MPEFNTIENFGKEYDGKTVLVRVDFNVPQNKDTGKVTDDTRVQAAIPTLKYIREQGGKLVIMSHLGDPKKDMEKNKWTEQDFRRIKTLENVVDILGKSMGEKVVFARDYIENGIPDENIVLLENTRFYKAETSKDSAERKAMAEKLASFADYYVCDAFGSAHRAHVSVYDTCLEFKGRAAAGNLMRDEINKLNEVRYLKEGDKLGAILGGAKVEDKIEVIQSLYPKVQAMAIVGAMMFAFHKARGLNVGESLCEGVEEADKLIKGDTEGKIYVPYDVVIAKKKEKGYDLGTIETVGVNAIKEGYAGLDIGPESVEEIKRKLSECNVIFWNGPAGLFEVPEFAEGTKALAEYLAGLQDRTRVIVGGGDSVTAINQLGLDKKFYHVSTGGGASLEMLGMPDDREYDEDKKVDLPAVKALKISYR